MKSRGFTATAEESGLRLDAALVSRGVAPSRSQAQRLIEAGLVTVQGSPRRASHRLVDGEEVVVAPAGEDRAEGPHPQAPFEVAFEDEHLIVVDKPAGVVVHPGAGHAQGTLIQALAGRAAGGGDPVRPGVVHRLDRDTSGLLVVAKSEEVHEALSQMLRERQIHREYLTLVEGHPGARSGTIDAPIGRDRNRRTVMSTRTDRPRQALTHFEMIEAFPRTTLLSVRLETGRTHQIRAHMAAIGHPVCGDAQYGGRTSGRRLGLSRQFLHSKKLMFSHPITGALTICESKAPADLRHILDVARREQVSGGPDGD
jgi:23S rRNA pseudouridine1911/1915/1917 synthase